MNAEDILPDGVNEVESNGIRIRKGSVGAFLANVAAFEKPGATGEAREAALADIRAAAPALRAIGLFDVMEIRNPQVRAIVGSATRREAADATDLGATAPSGPDLDALYAPPAEMIQKAVLDRLVDVHVAYLQAATFFCLATGSHAGLDASPRGGPPGFVHVLDPRTIAFADWPGNNRIESLRNISRDARVGMVFLFPGQEIFLRINGRGRISTAPDLLLQLSEGGRTPKSATIVAIDQVLAHCGKAINRAKLWADSSRLARGTLPTVGQMMAAFAELETDDGEFGHATIAQIDAHYDHAVRHDLY